MIQPQSRGELGIHFSRAFGAEPPRWLVRAPGRVDLMGSHTDYNGLPVLAMAIDREIQVVARPRAGGIVRLSNVDSRHPPCQFVVGPAIERAAMGDWSNYFRAPIQALCREWTAPADGWRGFDAAVGGDVPQGKGLSSSSAMVVAGALALLASSQAPLEDSVALAQLLARAEQYVGTEGGGMDQAASLLSQAGRVLAIEFFPLRARAVRLPETVRLAIVDSRSRAEKTGGARLLYNRRPVECRIAAALLARIRGIEAGPQPRLCDVLPCASAEECRLAAREATEALGLGGYELGEIARRLGLSEGETGERFLRLRDGARFPAPSDGFQLGRRARHVMNEAARVRELADMLEGGGAGAIGALMNESYVSCRDDYEISRPELDGLHQALLAGGAAGARIAGAGFGGCMLAVAEAGAEEELARRLEREYFRRCGAISGGECKDNSPPREDELFYVGAAQGASVQEI